MQEFDRFMEVVRTIREKCPWDSVQTHESLKKYLVEESQEVLDGIEEGLFTVRDVISGVTDKMKFRHPKIFAPEDSELCSLSWEALKAKEQSAKSNSNNNKRAHENQM